MADDPAAAPVATPAAPAAPAADTPWHVGIDTDLAGYIQNRGLDKMSAKEAALTEAKAHREAERLLGAPPENLVRIPKDANDKDGWGRVYGRLGVPVDPKEYDFGTVKHANGNELDEGLTNGIRTLATEQHLLKDQATSVARFIAKQADAAKEAEAAAYNEKLSAEKTTLKANWGSNASTNMVVAQNAATKLGVTAEELAVLEKTVGYARVMEMFRNIGARIGEDTFVRDGGGGGPLPATREAAQAQMDLLQTDTEWVEKFNKGDIKSRQQFDNLTRIIAGVV